MIPLEYRIATARSAAVIDSHGAQLLSLRDAEDREYIWQRDARYWARSAPVLFPVVGRLREKKIVIEGNTYEMPRHGFARDSAFEAQREGEAQVAFVLRDNEQTRTMYPYAFQLTVRFALTESALRVGYQVKNTDSRDIQFCIGAHPAFNCPLSEEERFSDYELRFEKPETVRSPELSSEGITLTRKTRDVMKGRQVLGLDYSLFEADAVILEGLNSREVVLASRKSGRGIRFGFPDYGTLAFWTPPQKEAPFLCLEPWFGMGARDDDISPCLSDKKGVVTLGSGNVFSAEYTVEFLDMV